VQLLVRYTYNKDAQYKKNSLCVMYSVYVCKKLAVSVVIAHES